MSSQLPNSGGSDDARGPWVATRTPRRGGYHSLVVGRLREECLGTFGAARASTSDEPVNLPDSPAETHQHCSPADASCCHSLLLIQMLRSALTCANGCSCWSPDEENSPQSFPYHGCALPTELGGQGRALPAVRRLVGLRRVETLLLGLLIGDSAGRFGRGLRPEEAWYMAWIAVVPSTSTGDQEPEAHGDPERDHEPA